MSKKKKESPRPRFECKRCGMIWVNLDPVCIICGIYGKPLNEGAEKLIKKGAKQWSLN